MIVLDQRKEGFMPKPVSFQLIDIGRNKVNRVVEGITNEHQLVKECKQHLASHDVEIEWTGGEMIEGVVLAGFRTVGAVRKLAEA